MGLRAVEVHCQVLKAFRSTSLCVPSAEPALPAIRVLRHLNSWTANPMPAASPSRQRFRAFYQGKVGHVWDRWCLRNSTAAALLPSQQVHRHARSTTLRILESESRFKNRGAQDCRALADCHGRLPRARHREA